MFIYTQKRRINNIFTFKTFVVGDLGSSFSHFVSSCRSATLLDMGAIGRKPKRLAALSSFFGFPFVVPRKRREEVNILYRTVRKIIYTFLMNICFHVIY